MLELDGTFIFVFLSFIVFVCLMNLICYKPIMKIIGEREKFYAKNKETEEKTGAKIDEIKAKETEEIKAVKLESSKMLKEALYKENLKKQEILNARRGDIENSFKAFETKLDETSNGAKEQLKSEIETYVKSTVSKVLGVSPAEVPVDLSKTDGILE